MGILSAIRQAFGGTEEDHVINAALEGNHFPFVKYFGEGEVPFTRVNHRRSKSPSGRVIVERDIYLTVYIDGNSTHDIPLPHPYPAAEKIRRRMKEAVLSNCPGTMPFERKHHSE